MTNAVCEEPTSSPHCLNAIRWRGRTITNYTDCCYLCSLLAQFRGTGQLGCECLVHSSFQSLAVRDRTPAWKRLLKPSSVGSDVRQSCCCESHARPGAAVDQVSHLSSRSSMRINEQSKCQGGQTNNSANCIHSGPRKGSRRSLTVAN